MNIYTDLSHWPAERSQSSSRDDLGEALNDTRESVRCEGSLQNTLKPDFLTPIYRYRPQKSENITFGCFHSISNSHCALPVKMFSSKWSAFLNPEVLSHKTF